MLNNKEVIVTYRHFHNSDRIEIPPEVFRVAEGETSAETLRRIYDAHYEGGIEEEEVDDSADVLDKKNCWCHEEEGFALLTFTDGDTKEFYIIEVESFPG